MSIQSKDHFRRPERFFSEMLRRSAQGLSQGGEGSFLRRATVVAVDVVGGRLENPGGEGGVTHVLEGRQVDVTANVGPTNPRNSLKARIIGDGYDQFVGDARLRVFWPFYPEHVSIPVKPGEHVYVMFEDDEMEHGLWLSKIPGQENMNFFRGQTAFRPADAGSLSSLFPATQGVDSNKDQLNTDLAAGESRISRGRLQNLFGK